MVGARAPGTEQISQPAVSKKSFFEGYPVGWGGGQGLGRGVQGLCSGGVGGRGTGPRDGANFATCRIFDVCNVFKKKKNEFFLKDTLCNGGVQGSGGGGPGALVLGGVGGRGTGPRLRNAQKKKKNDVF